ncbi:MAG TPA: GEVED domain-containing protein [Chitinophagales bacterium]|nr:GEVED domain-containing protein [Chitinophagales bacterium]
MKKFYSRVCLLALFACASLNGFAQVSTYSFASSSTTFSSIVGGGGTVTVATSGFDQSFGTFPIGFTFTFNGNSYTTFGLNMNGFISMGYVPVSTDHALSSGLNNNIISGFNGSLYGTDAGAKISYQTSGSAGSRVLTVEWTNWGFFSTGGNEFNFQIKLLEGTNKIQVVYGSCPGNTAATLQVGVRGQTNTDYNNRTTTTNWAATTAGSTNSANCTYSSTVKPSSGLRFEWTPSATARTCGTVSAVQQTGTAAPGSTANTILRIDIPVTGTVGTLTLSSITVASQNTSDNDISTSGVKIWTGTLSGPATQVGSGASFSGGNATISSINTGLITGTNYIWVTFDIKTTAVVGHVLDAKINVGAISISASGGAANPGTKPSTILNPSGSKTVNYCTPFSTNGGCVGDKISGFTFAGINYSGNCVASPGYLDVGTTGSATQGQPVSFTLSCQDESDYGAIWIDFNDNASFDDAGELVYNGGPGITQTGTIVIPVSAPAGTHRVRIRDNYNAAPPSSCGSITFGETKDFRLTVNAATNCSGTPAASNTLSSINPVCNGVSFTLSLSVQYLNLGITYQWQSSPTGSTYTNISGATNYSLTTTQSASKYYRCKITCTNSGQFVNSTALLVSLNPFNNCYCTTLGGDCSDDRITSVVYGGISNTSSCSANAYGDYSGITGTANQGAAQSISVGLSNGGTEYVSVWIDYNHNSVFDASERTFIGSGVNQSISNYIQVPPTAITGVTRMRVRLQFAFEPTTPCDSFEFGETEDYSVNISTCTLTTYYADGDGDTYGNPNSSLAACSQLTGYVTNNTDCNDANAAIHPGVTEVCSNAVDDNCNGSVDEGCITYTYYADTDNDSYGNPNNSITSSSPTPPAGYVTNSTDCNDTNTAVHPGAADVCNSIDDNCNGTTDENAITATISPSGSVSVCKGTTLTLTANSGSGLTYQWIKGSTNVSGATNQTYSPTKTASYKVNESNSFNCSSTSAATSVTILAQPTATITAPNGTDLCPTGSVLLQANTGTGYTYQWLKGATTLSGATSQNYTATTKATYKVIVTNTNGCSKTSAGKKVTKSCKDNFVVNVNSPASLALYPNPTDGSFEMHLQLQDNFSGNARISIVNTLGQIVLEQEIPVNDGDITQAFDLGKEVAEGMYFVKVMADNQVFTSQLMINR